MCVSQHHHPSFDTSIFNGLRVQYNFIVVFGHTISFMPAIRDDLPNIIVENLQSGTHSFLTVLTAIISLIVLYSVDVFLFISGYLFAHSFTGKAAGEKYKWRHAFRHLTNRFLRLFPIFAMSWAVAASRGGKACTKPSMIWEFLHLFNLKPEYGRISFFAVSCVMPGWSLSTDFQAHIFMVLLLIVFKSKKRTFQALFLATIIVILMRMQFVFNLGRPMARLTSPDVNLVTVASSSDVLSDALMVNGLPRGNFSLSETDITKTQLMLNDFRLYSSPHLRVAPVFIGFLTWYAVTQRMTVIQWMCRHPVPVLLGSFLLHAGVLVASSVLGELNGLVLWAAVLFDGLHRVVFTVAFAAFVIVIGHPVNEVKSFTVRVLRRIYCNGMMEWVSDLSYAIYLMHLYLQGIAAKMYPRFTVQQFEIWRLVASAIQGYLLSIVVAVPCHFVEKRFHSMSIKRGKSRNVGKANEGKSE